MAYVVRITPRARPILPTFSVYQREDSESAQRWYKGLREAALTLEELPSRCPVTPENPQLRQMLYGRKPHIYRVIFRVLEKEEIVNVLHVRHGASEVYCI